MRIEKASYNKWLESIKQRIKTAQLKAAVSVNAQLLEVYWDLGKEIVSTQQEASWGDSVYSTLSAFVPQPVAQIPWGHNRLIISKIKNTEEALFYSKATIKNGWSREQLEIQIQNNYYHSKVKSVTNFQKTLPEAQSQLAIETLKNPYNFDFLGLEASCLQLQKLKAN